MGNLSPGLKKHAVTMFEVGKLCDESLDSFLAELEKVSVLDAEGEGNLELYRLKNLNSNLKLYRCLWGDFAKIREIFPLMQLHSYFGFNIQVVNFFYFFYSFFF